MKKTFITGVLLLAVIAFGFSTFTSCKDTDEDLYNELQSEQVSLKALLEKLQNQINACPDSCQKHIDALETQLMEVIKAKADTSVVNGKADTAYVNSLNRKIDSLILLLQKELAKKATIGYVDTAVTNVNNRLDTLIDSLRANWPTIPEYPGFPGYQFSTEDSLAIKALLEDSVAIKHLVGMDAMLNAFFNDSKDSIGSLAYLLETLNELDKALYDKPNGLIHRVTSLENKYDTLNNKYNSLEPKVNRLQEYFDTLNITKGQFYDAVKAGQWVHSNEAALKELVKLQENQLLDSAALAALNRHYQHFEAVDSMYNAIFKDAQLPEGATDWWNYGTVMQKIMDNAKAIEEIKADIEKLKTDTKNLLDNYNDLVTSLVLQATTNSVFGSFNTPFGINSMVLMAPYGEIATKVREFPVNPYDHGEAECYMDGDIDWSEIISGDFYDLNERGTKFIVALNDKKQAKLGNLWFTVNPGTVNNLDVNGFAIVNSVEKDPVKVTNVTKDDETVLKFGVGSRAAGNGNGLYTAEATIDPDRLDEIKVHIEPGLVQSLKDAVKNRTASDMVQMLKAIYNQLQDVCDANALRYTYTVKDKDENGNWVDKTQKVYSNYGMAATAFKPLSYATLKGTSIGKNLPTFGSISIPEDLVNLDLGTFEIDGNTFKLNLNFGQPEFSGIEKIEVSTQVTLKDAYGGDVTGVITIDITKEAQEIQGNVTNAINEWLGADGGIDARVEKAIWLALFYDPSASDNKYTPAPGQSQSIGVVADLVNQVNGMMGSIQDKLDDLVDKINKDYLGKVNSLISKYNTVAERINNALKDPNHYLQSVMLYRKAGKLALNGHTPEVELPFGILSTNPKQPTVFKGAGEAVSLWATSYTFETVAPAFKKFVGVVSVKDENGVEQPKLAEEANKTLAKVMNGDQTRVAVNVKGAKSGYLYEVAYQALDYTGHTSTVKCYFKVVR